MNIAHERLNRARLWAKSPSLAAIFDEMASQFPGSIALKLGDQEISYQHLVWSANSAAKTLLQRDVGPGDCIGLFAHLSIPMMIGALAIQKVGAIIAFLDPHRSPMSHLVQVMRQSSCRLVLAHFEDIHLIPIPYGYSVASLEEISLSSSRSLSRLAKPKFKSDQVCAFVFGSVAGKLRIEELTHHQVVTALYKGSGTIGAMSWLKSNFATEAPCFVLKKESALLS